MEFHQRNFRRRISNLSVKLHLSNSNKAKIELDLSNLMHFVVLWRTYSFLAKTIKSLVDIVHQVRIHQFIIHQCLAVPLPILSHKLSLWRTLKGLSVFMASRTKNHTLPASASLSSTSAKSIDLPNSLIDYLDKPNWKLTLICSILLPHFLSSGFKLLKLQIP